MTLPVDSGSWSEALYSGSNVDCPVDSYMVNVEPVSLKLNTHPEGDLGA